MRPAILLERFRSRGVQLEAHGPRLHYIGSVTAEDLMLLREHKPELLALLWKKQQPAIAKPDDDWADGVPDGPCGLCGHQPLTEVRDWPVAGAARWLCLACAGRPVPSLEAVYASLSVDDRGRLLDEARAGDLLARLLLTLVPVSGAA